jgi:hypothetical protein
MIPLPPAPGGPPSQLAPPPLPVLPVAPELVLAVPLVEDEGDVACEPSDEQLGCVNIIEAASDKPVQ